MTELKNIASKMNFVIHDKTGHEKFCSRLAVLIFKLYPKTPLSTLKNYMNNVVPGEKQKQINKKDPIYEFLKGISDTEVIEWTKRFGQKRMKNVENMRKWIAQYLFEYDQDTQPLKTLQKYLT